MKLTHPNFASTLDWTEEQKLNELIVESPTFLRSILRNLNHPELESGLCFTEQGKTVSFQKVIDFVYNPLKLDFNNRRVITVLLKSLVKTSLSEDFYLETNKFKTKIIKYLDKLIDAEHFIFELSTNDFAVDAIAKAVDLHIVDDEDDYVDLLTGYMSMMSELANVRLFIFFNLRAILDSTEELRLLKNLKDHDLNVLLLENQKRPKIPSSARIIIDKDLCEL